MSPWRTRSATNCPSRTGRPTKTRPSGVSTRTSSAASASPFSSKRRRSSCSGTYGRDLMKRRNCAAVAPCADSPLSTSGGGGTAGAEVAAMGWASGSGAVIAAGWYARRSESADDVQVARGPVQRIGPIGGAGDDVLDARALAGPRGGAPPGGAAAGDPQRARRVRAVALAHATEVQHDRLSGADDAWRRFMVRRGGVRAAAHDGELGQLVALVEEPLAHFARHVRLGPSHEPAGGDGEGDSGGTSAGGTQQPALVGGRPR